MPRPTSETDISLRVVRQIVAGSSPACTDEAVQALQDARATGPEMSRSLDHHMLGAVDELRAALLQTSESVEEVQRILNQYSQAPLMPALYVHPESTPQGPLALVASNGGLRAVALSPDVQAAALACGDDVYLSSDQSVLVARASTSRPRTGEMATFERCTDDGRMVVKARGDELTTVEPVAGLDIALLKPGDSVRWDRAARLCFEKMEGAVRSQFLVEYIEDIPLNSVGGQAENLNKLLAAVIDGVQHRELARRFQKPCSNTILMVGPPGVGKTQMARVAASELQRVTGRKVAFAAVKGASWESMWVGGTQANIANLFNNLRQAADQGDIAVLFIDEVEAVARSRGERGDPHSSKFLSSLLAELDGFQKLENVSVIAACNRVDMLDSALVSRFGIKLTVTRPGREAAREIIAVHLGMDVPYSPNGSRAAATRDAILDTGVLRLFARNTVCTARLRDGKERHVDVSELVSGRLIKQICDQVKDAGFQRAKLDATAGVTVEDMETAVAEAIAKLAATITHENAHHILDGMDADNPVMGVTGVVRKVVRPLRYLNLPPAEAAA